MRRGRRDFWRAATRRGHEEVIERSAIAVKNRGGRGREQAEAQQAATVAGTAKGGTTSSVPFTLSADAFSVVR